MDIWQWFFLIILAALLIIFISPFASNFPDGLERTAENLGAGEQQAPFFTIGSYAAPLSALVGSIIIFLIIIALLWPLTRKR